MSFGYIEFIPKTIGYWASRIHISRVPKPLTLTYSVTNLCNSRCKTCNLWKHYQNNPEKLKDEFKLEEIEKSFKSIGHTYFFNISGGEPFLRKDLPEIVELACKHLTPRIIHTPTNAITPSLIEKQTEKIMQIINKYNPKIQFTIKPSFDAIGEKHDEIRGVKGNFENVVDTVARLKKLKEKYSNLHIGLGTVISKWSYPHLKETADYVKKLDVDSYIHEIAEQRSELFTEKSDIAPSIEEYEKAVEFFKDVVNKDLKEKNKLTRNTQAMRLLYYDLAVQTIKEKRQVIPCYAGWTNAHISPYGDIWPCCVLGYSKSMGNLRDFNYDFKRLWNSKQANEVRKYIQNKKCSCPMANVTYSNILVNPRMMLKVFRNMLK
ncbi:MAG: radical SAM protein [Candidatus Nanoarchaeia archaeon]|nr:radical SAM protein [Candidatus Nanoarchaeia archaeon]